MNDMRGQFHVEKETEQKGFLKSRVDYKFYQTSNLVPYVLGTRLSDSKLQIHTKTDI